MQPLLEGLDYYIQHQQTTLAFSISYSSYSAVFSVHSSGLSGSLGFDLTWELCGLFCVICLQFAIVTCVLPAAVKQPLLQDSALQHFR